MGISNNAPTMSYIHISGTSVVWNNETYMVQDFATNKRYIYWNADTPHQLNASNVMPNRSTKQYLVIVNDNGMHSLVPSTSDDFSISFEGNSNQAIKDRIFGLYEKNEEFGDKFVTIEQNIDGIRSIVGETEETTDGTLIDRMSNIEQRADEINLSVEEVSKKYNDDKEINELRENLNSSVIKLNSALGTFKSELTDYFKNNEISSEEQVKIKTQLEILTNKKVILEGYVNTVRLIAESNNQTQDVIALDSAKKSLQIAHDNLHNNVTNAIIDSIISPTENTIIIDSFAKYNLKINELKNTCDDIIILGVGGVITEELANISIKSNEIKLSVSKVESDFKNDMSIQKLELEGQIRDVNSALGTFEETVNTTFKDGIIDETEKSLLKEKINLIDKEKVDIDLRYNSIISDLNLSKEVKTELITKYNDYCNSHNKLKERIDSVISDSIVNDAEKIEIDTLFEAYSNALAYFSTLMNKAIENISFNSSKAELEQAKSELNDSINGVKDSIEGIDNILDGTFENNILDEVERENIKQNLKNLSKEKLDIDKIYTDLYNNTYLLNQDKINLKNAYDNYISKYNNVVKVSNDILAKEELVNNIDKANIDSAIANHNEALALFHVQANKSIDVISTNRINGAKSEINEDIENLKGDINGLNDYIDESFKDNVLSEAEKSAIKQNLKTLETNKLNIDKQYSAIYNNVSLVDTSKAELKNAYDSYVLKYDSLIFTINNVLNKDELLVESDNVLINNAFREYNAAIGMYSEKINEAIDSIALKNIEDAKNELSIDIRELGDSLGDLENTMNGAFKDGVLSESEKQSINQHLLTVSSKKTDIDKRYATLYSNEHLEGDAKTNLTTAYNNYIKAYNSLVTVINNILKKVGLVDSTDKNNLDNAFQEHNSKLGLYSTADLNALDSISEKKAKDESSKIDEKYADIITNPETGILSKVEHISRQIDDAGGISERLANAESQITEDAIKNTVSKSFYTKGDIDGKGYQTFSDVKQTVDKLGIEFKSKGGYNLLYNGDFKIKLDKWIEDIKNSFGWSDGLSCINGIGAYAQGEMSKAKVLRQNSIKLDRNNNKYTFSFWQHSSTTGSDGTNAFRGGQVVVEYTDGTSSYIYINNQTKYNSWEKRFVTIELPSGKSFKQANISLWVRDTTKTVYFSQVMLEKGTVSGEWSPNPNEIYDGITTIDKDGITVEQTNAKSKTTMTANGFAITRTDNNKDIFRVGSNGLLTLNGVFKCYKDGANQTGDRLESSGAIMFGYNERGGNNPVFASGLWTNESMGYFSVGYTRADISDANGCLWISPTTGNDGCRLTYSKAVGSEVKSTNLYFKKNGTIEFATNMAGMNDTDNSYTYLFDSGVSTKSLKCYNLRSRNIIPLANGTYNLGRAEARFKDTYTDTVSTTNHSLILGTVTDSGTWQTYGGMAINSSTGYVFPHLGNGNLSLGSYSNRFHILYSINAVNVSSDKRLKTDIHYLDEPMEEVQVINGDMPRVSKNMNITTQDMYDFVKNDLKLASYRYKANIERGDTSVDYNFIAQDILYTKVGSEIVQLEDKEDLDSLLSYNQGNYISVVVGALQKEIELRDKQISDLEERLLNLEGLINKILEK